MQSSKKESAMGHTGEHISKSSRPFGFVRELLSGEHAHVYLDIPSDGPSMAESGLTDFGPADVERLAEIGRIHAAQPAAFESEEAGKALIAASLEALGVDQAV
jgi:hypothetical protein